MERISFYGLVLTAQNFFSVKLTLTFKSLCECDREFAMSIEALDIETEYNPLYLKRNGFDQGMLNISLFT